MFRTCYKLQQKQTVLPAALITHKLQVYTTIAGAIRDCLLKDTLQKLQHLTIYRAAWTAIGVRKCNKILFMAGVEGLGIQELHILLLVDNVGMVECELLQNDMLHQPLQDASDDPHWCTSRYYNHTSLGVPSSHEYALCNAKLMSRNNC